MSEPLLQQIFTDLVSSVRRLRVTVAIADGTEIFTDTDPGVVSVDGSISEYLWLSTDTAPTPAAGDRVLGVEINTSTHVMTVKYWNGTAWGDVA